MYNIKKFAKVSQPLLWLVIVIIDLLFITLEFFYGKNEARYGHDGYQQADNEYGCVHGINFYKWFLRKHLTIIWKVPKCRQIFQYLYQR